MALALELRKVRHSFPGVLALDDVSFDVRPGEVHALVGENGAGKSTLVGIASGVLQPDSGTICSASQEVQFANPVVARQQGIVTVFQEAEYFSTLSVAENMALLYGYPTRANGSIDWPQVDKEATSALTAVSGQRLTPDLGANQLGVASRHMSQIAMAVRKQARVVILDEPTSALTIRESDWLFAQIEAMKKAGVGIVYISHRQSEIFTLADRITVLRDGKNVWTRDRDEVTQDSLIAAMVGRELALTTSRPIVADDADVRFQFDIQERAGMEHVDVSVRAGEIVGVYGLVGAGRTELLQRVCGLEPAEVRTIAVDGSSVRVRSVRDALAAGVVYLPEDRLRQGVFSGLSIRDNLVVSTLARWCQFGVCRRKTEQAASQRMIQQLAIRCQSSEQSVGQLSGGNQQKVVLGRWLLAEPRVLILDEPTRGVDVGAKHEIHRLLREIAATGVSVLMVSSDLPEVLGNSNRVLVMRDGQVCAEFPADTVSAEEVAQTALPDESATAGELEKSLDDSWWRGFIGYANELALLLAVSALLLALWATTDFISVQNLNGIAADVALWTILGLAAAVVIIAGGVDISLGSLLALCAAVAGLILKLPLAPAVSIPLAVVAAVAVGCCGGLLNGSLSLLGRVHPIVISLGMLTLYRGIVITILQGKQINELPTEFAWLAVHPPSGIRGTLFVGFGIAAALAWVLGRYPLGRHLYAVGTSRRAAELAGISISRVWLFAFALSGVLIGVAAVLTLSDATQMQSRLGTGWELRAIAIAVIGGVSITGGRGTVIGVVLSALLLRLVDSALVHWEAPGEYVDLAVGTLILIAVLLDLGWRKAMS